MTGSTTETTSEPSERPDEPPIAPPPVVLTDPTPIHDDRAERAIEARRHREAARRSTALAIGSGDIGTYRILMAVAVEHEARAADLERGVKRRG